MALFYVIYLQDGIAVDCIEAIRLLSDPLQIKAAHITVRGPFPNKIRLADANKKLSGNRVVLNGVSHFISESQNTVFFTCSATKIKKVWNKPDFPFKPHVTIYDGTSKAFASQLYDVVSKYTYFLGFHADKITPLISKDGHKKLYRPLQFDEEQVSNIVGEHFTNSLVSGMSEHKRFLLIERLCSFLSEHSLNTDENFLSQTKSRTRTWKNTLATLRQGFIF
jgi:2'-5' RNA ligase